MNTISQMFVCVQAFLLLSAGLTAASEPAARKPNIILIMADDASDTVFGSYGSSHFSTPKLDALAREGLRFNHCYSVNLCVPTRVEILTGKYSHRNFLGKGTLARGERTIAHVLKAQGYRTCLAAKWQVSVRRGQKPAEAGFDQWCYNAGPADFYWDPKIDHDGKIRSLPGEYGPDVYLDYVCQFVEDNRDRPFFVFYAMHLPHGPNHWPPAPDGSRPDLPNPDDPLAQYEKMVAYGDGLVGRLLQQLDELQLREETIVLLVEHVQARGQHPEALPVHVPNRSLDKPRSLLAYSVVDFSASPNDMLTVELDQIPAQPFVVHLRIGLVSLSSRPGLAPERRHHFLEVLVQLLVRLDNQCNRWLHVGERPGILRKHFAIPLTPLRGRTPLDSILLGHRSLIGLGIAALPGWGLDNHDAIADLRRKSLHMLGYSANHVEQQWFEIRIQVERVSRPFAALDRSHAPVVDPGG